MRKKWLLPVAIVIVIAIITILVIRQNQDPVKKKAFKIVEDHYGSIMQAVDQILKYDSGSTFYVPNATVVEEDHKLKAGTLHVEHVGKPDKMINDQEIESMFVLMDISGIERGKKAINFTGTEPRKNNPDYGFGGFYYSINGEPQIVRFFEEKSLKKDGKGWSLIRDEEYSAYYTEKIKGHIYYYEGAFYP